MIQSPEEPIQIKMFWALPHFQSGSPKCEFHIQVFLCAALNSFVLRQKVPLMLMLLLLVVAMLLMVFVVVVASLVLLLLVVVPALVLS